MCQEFLTIQTDHQIAHHQAAAVNGTDAGSVATGTLYPETLFQVYLNQK